MKINQIYYDFWVLLKSLTFYEKTAVDKYLAIFGREIGLKSNIWSHWL